MKVKKIDKDEKHDLEFKQNWRDEYLKWICAFANTHGGSLYIGVKDNGEVVGQDIGKDTLRYLSRDIANGINPSFWINSIALLKPPIPENNSK